MKDICRFCINSIIFGIITLAVFYLCDLIFPNVRAFFPHMGGAEIYKAIIKSKKKSDCKKLIIGDSTASQFFHMDSKDENGMNSLSNNQAISVCGQFFLINNYIKAGNRPDVIYLLYNPFSFQNNLDQIYTFHYFLKPFYNEEYKPLMTNVVSDQICKIPYYKYSQVPLFIGPAWAPDYPSDYHRKGSNILSPVTVEYLDKMDSLQSVFGFKLCVVPTFVPQSKAHLIDTNEVKRFKGRRCEWMIKKYFENIRFLPDSCFIDGIHLSNPMEYKDSITCIMNNMTKK